MTNLQEGGSGLSGALLRRFWLGLPIAAGGAVALLLGALVFLPQLLALQADQKRMGELEEMERRSLLIRGQIRASQQSADKAQAQQNRLFEIVSGRGDLSTFMAMVDREAKLAGVQLDLFEPQAAAASPAAAPGAAAKPPPAPPAGAAAGAGAPGAAPAAGGGAVEVPGLTRESILLTARGPYPALLEFLRRLERLDVLVEQQQLKLLLEESKSGNGEPTIQTPVLKVLLSLYARPSAAVGGSAAPGQTPPPSPAAGQAPAPSPAAAGAAAAPAAAPAVPAR